MILIILLVLALFVLQTLLPSLFRQPPGPGDATGIMEILGNRDRQRPPSVVGGRAARALANMQEALPVFLALALLNLIVGTAAATAITGAWIFFAARMVYLPVYMAGIPVLRTLIWTGGWVGLVMMLIPLLDRI
jgi:uncharacterized MAPEG superfamily protein